MGRSKVASMLLVMVCVQMCWSKGDGTPFTKVWESQLDNKSDYYRSVSTDGAYVLGATNKVFAVLSGADGKKVSGGDYNSLCGFAKPDNAISVSGAGLYIVFSEKKGDAKDDMIAIDMASGKIAWKNTSLEDIDPASLIYIPELKAIAVPIKDSLVMLDAANGNVMWRKPEFYAKLQRFAYSDEQKALVTVSYMQTMGGLNIAAAFALGKTQISAVDVTTGKALWDNTYKFIASTVRSPQAQKDLVGVSIEGNKVLARLDGLKVLDLATGKEIWNAGIDSDNFGKAALHALQLPAVMGGAVYMTDLDQHVAKYDQNNGAKLWETEIENSDYLPALQAVGDKVIVQRGGYICEETEVRNQLGFISYKHEWEMDGPYGIAALEAASGKLLWNTEKFKGGITTIVAGEDAVYCASGEFFYGINAADGSDKFAIARKELKLGEPRWTLDNGSNVVVVSENGVSAHAKADGSVVWKVPFKGITNYQFEGDNFFVNSADEEKLAGIDLATGKLKGELEYGDVRYTFTEDGEYIFTFDGPAVCKYKVN
jgi:outer membrane protein assembly factor BamB